MDQSIKTSWRILSAIIIVVASAAFIYGLVGVLSSNDPLITILIPLLLIPSAFPIVLGILTWRGHRWAMISLRLTILIILTGGTFLDVIIGLDVFSFAPFSIPFITFCVLWLAFSFK